MKHLEMIGKTIQLLGKLPFLKIDIVVVTFGYSPNSEMLSVIVSILRWSPYNQINTSLKK